MVRASRVTDPRPHAAERRVPGTVGWVELTTNDIDVSLPFYVSLFGWRTEAAPTPHGGHHIGFLGYRAAAGIIPYSGEMEAAGLAPGWMTFFRVADLDGALHAADAEGAKVAIGPVPLRPRIRAAVLVDPFGAEFGLFEGPTRAGLHLRTQTGAPCWAEMVAPRPHAAEEFYVAMLGWGTTPDPVGKIPYTTFTAPRGRRVAGLLGSPELIPVAGARWVVYFAVQNGREAVASTLRLGGATVTGPISVSAGTFTVMTDPLGAVFAVLEPVSR